VGGAFFVGCAATFAGDFALLFGRHRSKTASFFTHSVHSNPSWYVGHVKARLDQAPEALDRTRTTGTHRTSVLPPSPTPTAGGKPSGYKWYATPFKRRLRNSGTVFRAFFGRTQFPADQDL